MRELTGRVRGGDYDRILGGNYPRRGESDLQADADTASEYYVNRLWNVYREASEGAQGLRDRVDEWLRRDDGKGAEEDGEETDAPG